MRPTIACVFAGVLLAGTAACSRSTAQGSRTWSVLFGPIAANELIVGRTALGRQIWIATDSNALIHVEIDSRQFTRSTVTGLLPGERIWGLAQAAGSLWTLAGRHTLARVDQGGAVLERRELSAPHMGLYSNGRQLIYQVANVQPPADAFMAGPPGDSGRTVWGNITTRAMPLVRGAVAALNLVSCGPPGGLEVPCWFPDSSSVALTDRSGRSVQLAIENVPAVAPEVLLASQNPQRPIRDAVVTTRGGLWVLASAEGPADERPGGRQLIQFDSERRETGRLALPEPARLILRAADRSAVLLAWDGRVVEVRP